MAKFLFVYRAPKNYKVGTASAIDAWSKWFDDLGDNVVERGNPVFESATVGNSGSDGMALGGYSLIAADDLEEALTLAKGCPFVGQGGDVEVGSITVLDGPVA
ncbi:MAG TPA: hypothetical protein VEJ87_11145 [Acidimicrobiales bacterium]|nr:hypothetical protein [Acidimicrobiales bacterium]